MTTTGFIVYVPDNTTSEELTALSTTIFRIKGVQAIMPIRQPFEIYGLRAACEAEVARKLLGVLETS